MKLAFLIISILGLCFTSSFSQNDTLISPELESNNDLYKNKLYDLLIEDEEREVSHLWKINLIDIGLVEPNFGFEKRLGKAFSSETYLNVKTLDYHNLSLFNLHVEFEEQLKFYYNLKRRERLEKRTSGFSGNYISLFCSTDYFGYSSGSYTFNVYGINPNGSPFSYGGGLKTGLQRRIGNIGYIDGFIGLKIQSFEHSNTNGDGQQGSSEYSAEGRFIVGIRLGFAIDSFKNLKHMLK